MEIILLPITIFATFPILGVLVSVGFVFGTLSKIHTPRNKVILAICALLWFLFSILNFYMLSWRSETGDMAIRVDLVLLGPIIIIATIVGIVTIVMGALKK